MKNVVPILLACLVISLVACQKRSDNAPQNRIIDFEVPSDFPTPVYQFQTNNSLSVKGFELGRKLFYDKRLSIDNSVSCASCHFQHAAFSDPGKALSSGVNGAQGRRNSPPLFNLAWHPHFNWDGGVNHIEIFSVAPITDENEMNMPLNELLERLNGIANYQKLFKEAFDVDDITSLELLYALTQFMAVKISDQSLYDEYRRGQSKFNAQQKEGLNLFNQHCASCHTPPLFSNFGFANNGIDSIFNDEGRKEITHRESDLGKFKIPSLRNVELTWPYMHDGRMQTLEDVINHYSEGIIYTETLAPELKNLHLSLEEKKALLAFLKTLTDHEFINNPLFSEP